MYVERKMRCRDAGVLNFVIKSRSFGDEELGIGFRTTQAIIGSCSRMFGLMLEGC